MANFTCRLSGLRLSVQGFSSLEAPLLLTHPIFSIPLTKLVPYVPEYFQGKLNSEESYLLYLAIWNQTGKLQFRSPGKLTSLMPGIIARTIDSVLSVAQNLQTIRLDLPSIIISEETNDFLGASDWLDTWDQCFKDYKDHYKTSTAIEKLTRKESTLEKYIKDPTKDISSYAHQLAMWAQDAGNFPTFSAGLDKSILGGQEMSLAAYWRYIIKACCKVESIWEIPQSDLVELIEHCEEHIPHGSIYAQELMSLLRSGQTQQNNYLNIGDVDVGMNGVVFRILNGDESVEDAAKLALIDSAPKEKPIESHYPNKLAYLKAKMNFRLAEDYRNSDEIKRKLAEAEDIMAAVKINKES